MTRTLMNNSNFKVFELCKARTIGGVFADTFGFMAKAKNALLYYLAPCLALLAVIQALLGEKAYTDTAIAPAWDDIAYCIANAVWGSLEGLMFDTFAALLSINTVYCIIRYYDKGSNCPVAFWRLQLEQLPKTCKCVSAVLLMLLLQVFMFSIVGLLAMAGFGEDSLAVSIAVSIALMILLMPIVLFAVPVFSIGSPSLCEGMRGACRAGVKAWWSTVVAIVVLFVVLDVIGSTPVAVLVWMRELFVNSGNGSLHFAAAPWYDVAIGAAAVLRNFIRYSTYVLMSVALACQYGRFTQSPSAGE